MKNVILKLKQRTRQAARRTGQALVEFALAATLIFFLLAAAVDLGLIFFALQGLNNASAEGGTFGSTMINTVTVNNTSIAVLQTNEIRDRVRKEAGVRGGIGFVNLLDLDNNGVPDVQTRNGCANAPSEPTVGNPCSEYQMVGSRTDYRSGVAGTNNPPAGSVVDQFITVIAKREVETSGFVNRDSPDCVNIADVNTNKCFVYIEVQFNYRPIFPLAPVIGGQETYPIRSRYFIVMRNSMSIDNRNAQLEVTANCAVPNLVGLRRNDVAGAVQAAGFTATADISALPTRGSPTVGGQSPAAGQQRPCNFRITVFP